MPVYVRAGAEGVVEEGDGPPLAGVAHGELRVRVGRHRRHDLVRRRHPAVDRDGDRADLVRDADGPSLGVESGGGGKDDPVGGGKDGGIEQPDADRL